MIELWESIQLRLQQIFDPAMLGAQLAEWLANFTVGLMVVAFFYSDQQNSCFLHEFPTSAFGHSHHCRDYGRLESSTASFDGPGA